MLEGILLDSESMQPISYAHIYMNEHGTYSNEEGQFKFVLQKTEKYRLLTISCIGYAKKDIQIDTLSARNTTIYLEPITQQLEALYVKSGPLLTDAKTIVKRAIEHIPHNQSSSTRSYTAFISQSHYINFLPEYRTKYLKYREAILTLNARADHTYNSHTHEIRVSNDIRKQYTKHRPQSAKNLSYDFDFEDNFLRLDYINKYPPIAKRSDYMSGFLNADIGNLNNDFIRRHQFALEGTNWINEELVYEIKIMPSKHSTKPDYKPIRKLFIPSGKLYISADDYRIYQYEYGYLLNKSFNDELLYNSYKVITQGDTIFWDIVKYSNYDGQMWLSYIMRDQGDPDFRSGFESLNEDTGYKTGSGFFRIKTEMVITNSNQKTNINNTDFRYTSPLQDTYTYNPSFWKSINHLTNTRKKLELIRDLGNGMPLEDQYRINSQE